MSLSLEELIVNAQKLAIRLKDDELKADVLIGQTKKTHDQIEAMKQYSEDVEKLNEAASQRPYSVLVAGLQRESQHLRELQAENCELHSALGDHQNAIELIMSKYRKQVSQLLAEKKIDLSAYHNTPQCSKIIIEQYAQINKMRQIMREAAEADEESFIKDQEFISRLITENKGLREMVQIYKKYGCQNISAEEEEVVQKQPENPSEKLIENEKEGKS